MKTFLLFLLIMCMTAFAGDVASSKDYCLFVHSSSSGEDAGGCTKAFLAANGVAAVYDSSGDAVASDTSVTITTTTGVVASATLADDADMAIGLVAYVWSPTENDGGYYEVTAFDAGANTITLSGGSFDLGSQADYDVYVGGAYSNIECLLETAEHPDGLLAAVASTYNCFIYTNKGETIDSQIGITTSSDGEDSVNSKLYIIGYNTEYNDCDVGGAFHETPWEAYKNGGPTASSVVTWTNTNTDNLVAFGMAVANLEFRNIYFTEFADGTDYDLIEASMFNYAVSFKNCRSLAGDSVIADPSIGTYVIADCWFGKSCDNDVLVTTGSMTIYNSILEAPASKVAVEVTIESTFIIDSLIIGTTDCVIVDAKENVFINSVFVGANNSAIQMTSADAKCVLSSINCVYYLDATTDFWLGDTGGTTYSMGLLSNNLVYSAGGALADLYECTGELDPVEDVDTFQTPPSFMNSASGDYRLNSSQRMLGKETMFGDKTPLGLPFDTPAPRRRAYDRGY